MENNSFEKEVRRALEDFRPEPDEKIWPAVETQIRRKRRPVPLFLLALSGALLLLAGGHLLWNQGSSVADPESVMTPPENVPHPGENVFPQEKNSDSGPTAEEPDTGKNNSEKSLPMTSGPSEKEISSASEKISGKTDRREEISVSPKTIENKSTPPEPAGIDLLPPLNPEKIPSIRERTGTIEKVHPSPLTGIVPQEQQKKGWDLSMAVTGGSAMLFDSFLDFRGDPNDPPRQDSPDPNPGNPTEPGTGGSPRAPAPAFSFSAHLMIRKTLSPRTHISFAPGYRQIGIRQRTGEKITTPGGEYFSNTPDAPYRYRGNFHFLELPVSIETRLNESSSLPLFWHGGLHISRLLASDVLQFDEDNSYYIRDDGLFSPWQAGLSTGVHLMLFTRQKHPLKIGPYFHYNFSKIAREGLYGGKHHGSVGLKMEVLLN